MFEWPTVEALYCTPLLSLVAPGVAVNAQAPGLTPFWEPQPSFKTGSIPVATLVTTKDPILNEVPLPTLAVGVAGVPVIPS